MEFSHPLLSKRILSVRGRESHGSFCTFQWSSSVKALALVALRTKLKNSHETAIGPPHVLSLWYALRKPPLWIQELFGSLKSGRLLCRRVLRRKMIDGRLDIAFNEREINADQLEFRIDGIQVTDPEKLKRLAVQIYTPSIKTKSRRDEVRLPTVNFHEVLEKEIAKTLSFTNIFTSLGVRQLGHNICRDPYVKAAIPRIKELLEELCPKGTSRLPLNQPGRELSR